MTRAVVASDPGGVVDDYAAGYGFDLKPEATVSRFASNGGVAPAGAVIASLQDMAAFARLQLRQGVSVTGARVASAARLAECWTAESSQTLPPGNGTDLVTSGYGLGFSVDTYRDGTRVIWQNGALDGFTSYVGFLPQHDLGLVVLTNMNVYPTGSAFYSYVLNLLLHQRFGLNPGVADQALAASDTGLAHLAQLGRQARPVDPRVVEPFLGYYEHDYALVRDGGQLRLLVGPRRLTLAAMPDGSYVVSDGLLPGNRVNLKLDKDGHRRLEFVGFESRPTDQTARQQRQLVRTAPALRSAGRAGVLPGRQHPLRRRPVHPRGNGSGHRCRGGGHRTDARRSAGPPAGPLGVGLPLTGRCRTGVRHRDLNVTFGPDCGSVFNDVCYST